MSTFTPPPPPNNNRAVRRRIRFTKPALAFIFFVAGTFLLLMVWLVSELFDISFGDFL
jgi:hypothetical protein